MEYLDMLAKLGIGNAHPGGFAATLKQLEQYPLPMNSRILEVGCGTGRTSCYLAAQGHDVTGIDIRTDMISKAILRANEENVSAVFLEGNACSLPFESYSFDVILVESVSIYIRGILLKPYQHIDAGSIYDTALWEVAHRYNSIMERYQEYMGFIHFMGTKYIILK